MPVLLGLLALSVLTIAGCGSSGDSRTAPTGPPMVTTGQVIAGFASLAKAALVAEDQTPDYDRLDVGAAPSDRFGDFSIYVIKRDVAANVRRLTAPTDGEFARQGYARPDARGIIFGKRCFVAGGPCEFTAITLFGANVVLVWQAPHDRRTNAQWNRLAATLARIAAGPPACCTTSTPSAATTATTATTPATTTDAKAVPASRVIAEFRKQTGERLAVTDSDADEVSLEVRRTARLSDKFGVFTIYVIKRDFDANVSALTASVDPGNGGDSVTAEPPDADAIVWRKRCDIVGGCTYEAVKRFGTSLVLDWQAGLKKETTPGWDRLAKVLTAAAR